MKTLKLDPIMIEILKGIQQNKSMDEIRLTIQNQRKEAGFEDAQFRSIGSVYRRLRELEEHGLVAAPPSPKMARSRKLTDSGRKVLNVYLPQTQDAPAYVASVGASRDAGSPAGQDEPGVQLSG